MSDEVQSRPSRWAVRLLTVVAVLLVALAVVGPEVRDPSDIIDFERQSQPPSASSPLGTDPLGRDYASRMADGVRTGLAFGLGAAFLWGGLCLAVGLTGRQLRRMSRMRVVNVAIDLAVAAGAIAIAILLCLDVLDPDAGWFQESNATSSPGFERMTLTLSLYESSVVAFVGVGIALGIWVSRTRLVRIARVRWSVVGILVLAALALRAEPYLAFLGASPVEVPSQTIGALIDDAARYDSTGWWIRVPLAMLWVAMVGTLLGFATSLGVRHLSVPAGWVRRVPLYSVAAAWAIALTTIIWRLTSHPIDDWAFWTATGLAVVGIVTCAATVWGGRRASFGHGVYVAAALCALPLALDWPLAKVLNFAVPRIF